jgi:MATE family multidrug resistance protein
MSIRTTRAELAHELGHLTLLGLPLMLTQMGQGLLGLVDVAVLGHADPLLLAGVGLGNALFFGIAILGMGVMHGLDPLVSQALGAGDPGRAQRLVWQGVWLAALLALALAGPISLVPRALPALGIPPDVAVQADRFLSWRLLGLPFFFVYFAPRSLLQAANRLSPMVIAVALANAVNLALVMLLVFGGASLPAWTGPLRAVPALGVVGSAWASNAASAVQVVILALAVRAELRGARSSDGRAAARPDRRDLALAFRVGLPSGLHMGAEVAFFALLGSTIAGRLGTIPLAAHQLALQLPSLTFLATTGIGNAGSVRVGLAVGGGDRAGARRAGLAALLGAAGFMTFCALVFLVFADPIARLMTDAPSVAATAAPLIRIAAAFQLFDGLQGVGAGILRGAGDTRYTFAANMVAFWAVGTPVVLLLCERLGWGIQGLWAGFVVGLALLAVLLVRRFLLVSAREIAPLRHSG